MKLLAGGALIVVGGSLAVGIFVGGFLAGIAIMHSAQEGDKTDGTIEVTP